MKKKLLSVAVLSAFLFACEESQDNKAGTSLVNVPPKSEVKTLNLADAKANAEKRYVKVAENVHKIYEQMLNHQFSGVKKIHWASGNFVANDNGGTGESAFSMAFNRDLISELPVELTDISFKTKDTILVNEGLLKDNIEARVNYQFYIDEELKNKFQIKAEDLPTIEKITNQIILQNDLLAGGKVRGTVGLDAIEHEANGEKIDFKGVIFQSTQNEDLNLNNIYVSDSSELNFKGLDYYKNGQKSLEIAPFSGKGSVNEQGNGDFKITKIFINDLSDSFSLSIDNTLFKLSNLKYSHNFAQLLGKTEMYFNKIEVKSPELSETVNLGDLVFVTNAEEQNNLLNISGDFIAKLNGEALAKQFEMPIALKDFTAGFAFKNFSQQTFLTLQEIGQSQGDEEKVLETLPFILTDFIKNQSVIEGQFKLDTATGDAFGSAWVKPRNGASLSEEIVKKAIADDKEAAKAISNAFDIHAEIKVKKSLLDAFGVTALVLMQGGEYVSEDGDYLKSSFTHNAEGTKINNKDTPF